MLLSNTPRPRTKRRGMGTLITGDVILGQFVNYQLFICDDNKWCLVSVLPC